MKQQYNCTRFGSFEDRLLKWLAARSKKRFEMYCLAEKVSVQVVLFDYKLLSKTDDVSVPNKLATNSSILLFFLFPQQFDSHFWAMVVI